MLECSDVFGTTDQPRSSRSARTRTQSIAFARFVENLSLTVEAPEPSLF